MDYEGNQRTETKMITRGILRELLLNAINHKNYATGVPIQVSVYEDKIEIFNMGSWSKRVPTDERIYEKHESVPYNPKIADVSFRSGDVESWGRGFLRIKTECNKINASLPMIDAENGGVSVRATGCEKYMSLLRYGQYGQVGADGVWRNKESDDELKHSSVLIGMDVKEYARLMEYLEIPRSRRDIQEFCGYKSRDSFMKNILYPLIELGKINLLLPDKPKSPKQKYVKSVK